MKLSVITVAYNQPEFILYQYKLLKKFLQNNFTFYIYDNSNTIDINNEITNICSKNNIIQITIPRNRNGIEEDASIGAGQSLDFSIKHNIENYNPDFGLILDSDMFLIKKYNFVENLISDYVGLPQAIDHIRYYNNQLAMLNFKKLKDFEKYPKYLPGIIEGVRCDCGCYLYEYFNKNKNITHNGLTTNIHSAQVNLQNIDSYDLLCNNNNLYNYYKNEIQICIDTKSEFESSKRPYDITKYKDVSFSELIFDDTFLHFRAGSNWINHDESYTKNRKQNLFDYFNKILKEDE